MLRWNGYAPEGERYMVKTTIETPAMGNMESPTTNNDQVERITCRILSFRRTYGIRTEFLCRR